MNELQSMRRWLCESEAEVSFASMVANDRNGHIKLSLSRAGETFTILFKAGTDYDAGCRSGHRVVAQAEQCLRQLQNVQLVVNGCVEQATKMLDARRASYANRTDL